VTVPVPGPPLPPAPAAASFNPLKVIIPSIVGLLVVFAVIYALRKSSASETQNTNQPQQTLAADPNSQPVQPGASPTGRGEQAIPAGGTVTVPANVNANANAEPSTEPVVDVSPPPANVNANQNSNTNANANANRKSPALPEPTRSVVPEAVPSPVATKSPEKAPPVPTPTPPL
jgi:hypothetical protein